MIGSRTMASATAGPSIDSRTLGYAAIWCTFAASGFVFIEPAPFDVAIVALIALYFLSGLTIPFDLAPMLTLVALVLIGNLLGLPVTAHFKDSAVHVAITGYLIVVALFLACLVRREPEKAFRVVMTGYAAAALLAATAGIVGYLGVSDTATELFTLYGRAKGPFKDPNVFGPFLVPPALYCLHSVFTRRAGQSLLPLTAFAVLALALLLSLSRGAWGFFALSVLVLVVLLTLTNTEPAFRLRITLWSALAGIFLVCLFAVAMNVDSLSRLIAERAQIFQYYDIGGHGRFDGQLHALSLIPVSPLGIGARDFSAFWGEEVHNVYLTQFMAGGWVAGLAYLSLVVVTAARGLAASLTPGRHQAAAIIAVSGFIGVAGEGLIVDTDHWRLFWILVGLVWALVPASSPGRAPSAPR